MMEQRTVIKAVKAPVLPEQFAQLKPFIAWSLATETERNIKRHESSMEEIEAFANAMLENVDAVVAHLNAFDVNALPHEERSLFCMLLSLAEVAPAIEFYQQQAVVDGYDPRRFPAEEDFVMRPAL